MEASAPARVEERFKQNSISILNIVLKIVQDNKAKLVEIDSRLVIMAIEAVNLVNADEAIELFITHSNPYWNEIKGRKVTFFLTAADEIFGQLPITGLSPFKLIFSRNIISETETTKLWDYLNQMVRQAVMYLKERSKNTNTVIIRKGQKKEKIYSVAEIDGMIKTFEVKIKV